MATAAAVVSISTGAMKPVLAKLTILMGDEYKKHKGLRREVTSLKDQLCEMDALLEKMDGDDELDPQARIWRKQIIEMSYNIEGHIDDFDLAVKENDKMKILRKAVRTFRLANQIHKIKAQVKEVSERQKQYVLDQCVPTTTPVVVDPRISALYKESTSLVGIQAQKDELVNWAFGKGQELKFMAIVGIGGSGKSTLANEVYHEVRGNFDCMAFVSVSQTPDIRRILNSLLFQLTAAQSSQDCEPYNLIRRLRTDLQDKRYFIVIDDLWYVQAWETISLAFPENSSHSRVVITTRIEGVARKCSGNHGLIHTMKPLSKANSRKLFFDRIFGSEDACPVELNQVSSKILERCGGLPLAIITMASMLASQPKRSESQLEYIHNSLTLGSTITSSYDDMTYMLDLSYKNLPRLLKTCFLYLGSYPRGHEISRVDLVRRWVAEGFVSDSLGQDVWCVAESCFNELINRSLIQPTFRKHFIGIFGCKVHGILFDLIMRRCKEDNFLSFVIDPEAAGKVQDVVIRRLTVVGSRGMKDDIKVTITTSQNLSKIRSLTILGESNWIPPLLEFKFLRVLALQSYHPRFKMDLTSISQLSQLRYLKVEGKVMLPYQIQGLRLLQTLDLSEMEVDGITLEIVDVPCLSHLVGPWKMRLPNRIIGEVKSLHTLRGFCLPEDSWESITGLGELTALSDLSFYLPNYSTQLAKAKWLAAMSTSLEKLGNLRQLHMKCGEVAWCGDVLSFLSPCFHNLEWLSMSGLTFSGVPMWIRHLRSLHTLSLGVKQMQQEDVAIIGIGMPSLLRLTLRIAGVPAERVVIGGSTGFPVLKYFKFDSDRTSYLTFEQGAMPELQELEFLFDLDEWDKAAPIGLQHLPRLKKIKAVIVVYAGTKFKHNDDKAAVVRTVFGEAAGPLPTRPAFTFKDQARAVRPREEAGVVKHAVSNDPSRLNIVTRPVRLLRPSEGFDSQQKDVKGQKGETSSTLSINEFPTSSSRGAMGPLRSKLDLLLDSKNQIIRRSAKVAIKLLKEDLEEINADLVEMSMVERPNYKSRYWMHEVRELSYHIEDCIDNMMQAHTATEAKMRFSSRSPQLSVRRHVKILCLPKTVKPFASLGLRRTLILSVSSSLVRHPGFLKRFSLSWRHESRHGAPLAQLHQALLLIRPPPLSARIAELRTMLREASERHERYQLQDCVSSEPRFLFSWNSRVPVSSSPGAAANLLVVDDGMRGKLTSWLIDQTEEEHQQLKATLHGYVRVATYPVSDTYPIRIRTGYAADTYP